MFERVPPKIVTLLIVIVSLSACGGAGRAGNAGHTGDGGSTGNGGSTDGASVTVAKACADFAIARCAKRQRCTWAGNASGANIVKAYGDDATCRARETLACMQSLSAKGSSSPDEIEACIATYASLSCADFLANNIQAPCVATGLLSDGSPCAFDSQCKSTYCINAVYSACGVCGQAPAFGADCSNSNCARGVGCLTLSSSTTPPPMQCTAFVLSGGKCNLDKPCDFGLSCVGATKTTMGSCKPAVTTVGGACDPSQQSGPGCDRPQGLYCNARSKTCTPIIYAASGADCGLGNDGNFTDCIAGDCYDSGYGVGTAPPPPQCKAKVIEGAACDLVDGPACQAPAKCITAGGSAGICVLPDGNQC